MTKQRDRPLWSHSRAVGRGSDESPVHFKFGKPARVVSFLVAGTS
jgi:hypothetical protein